MNDIRQGSPIDAVVEVKNVRSERHRRFIASLACCVTGREGLTQAAHIRSGFFCMSRKPSDSLCVPLSWPEHLKQHETSEAKYWKPHGGIENIKKLAADLYAVSGDQERGIELVARFYYGNLS